MRKHPSIRPVRIEEHRFGFFVRYTDRQRGERYLAGQFSNPVSREYVENWVQNNPKIKLEESK